MTSIHEYFAENIYNILVSYCEENNISTVEELLESDLNELTNLKGLGPGKYRSILEKLRAHPYSAKIKNFPEIKYPQPRPQKVFLKAHPDLEEYSVDIFFCLGETEKTIEVLKENGIYLLKDIYKLNLITTPRTVVRIHKKLSAHQIPLEAGSFHLINQMLTCIRNDENFDILIKRSMGITLREIGENLGVSRERIRQRESRILNRLKPLTDAIVIYVKKNKPSAQMLNLNKIKKLVPNEAVGALKYALKMLMSDQYLDFADKILLNGVSASFVNERLAAVTESVIQTAIEFNRKTDEISEALISEGLSFIKIHDLLHYLLFHGYKKIGDYVLKKTVSYAYLCTFLVEKYFPDGIRLYDEDDILKLREYASKDFGKLVLPDSDRAFSVRLTSFLVLCDRGTYVVPSKIRISAPLLSEIYNYIQTNKNKTVIFNDIYLKFKDRLDKETNITNRYYLQGVVKYYYSKDFEFTRDCVTVLGNERQNVRSMLRDYLQTETRPVSRQELLERFPGLTEAILSNIQSNDPAIIQWDSKHFIHIDSLNIQEDFTIATEKALGVLFKKFSGYATEQLLYHYFKENYSDLLEKYSIGSFINLYNVVNFFYHDKYTFRRPHIMEEKNTGEDLCSENIIKKFLFRSDFVNYQDYLNCAESWKWHVATVYCAFKNVEKDLYRIDYDDYILKEKFSLRDEHLEQIKASLTSYLDGKAYLPLCKFTDFSEFPDIGLTWNTHLLHTIITHFCADSFRILAPLVDDRRYVKGAIVPNSSPIKEFDEFIAYLLKTEVKKSLSSHQLEEYLVSTKIVNKYLPKELYNSKYLKYENELFSPQNI